MTDQPRSPVCECGHHHTRHIGQQPGRPELHCLDCPCQRSTVDTRWYEHATVAETASGPRAAQIQAVRDILGQTSLGPAAEDFAARLVDAVHAAGRDQSEPRIPADQVGAYADDLTSQLLAELDEAVNTTETVDSAARRYAGEIWRLASGLAGRDIPLAPDAPIDTAPVDTALATIDQLRYERHLLGVARMTLDLVAAGDPTRWAHARAEAEDVAQRIVDEIGHPVTDEPALGPDLRAQLAEANARADQGEARGWAGAVQALRDDQRYDAWVRSSPWAARVIKLHLADYLEAVGPDGTGQGQKLADEKDGTNG